MSTTTATTTATMLDKTIARQKEVAAAGTLLGQEAKARKGIEAGILLQAQEILRGEWKELEEIRVGILRKLRDAEGLTALSQKVQAAPAPIYRGEITQEHLQEEREAQALLNGRPAPKPTYSSSVATAYNGPEAPAALADGRVIPNGLYTVVLEDGEHRTIRITDDWRDDAPAGSQVAQFLNGPDNSSDYCGFAFVQGSRAFVWKKYSHRTRTQAALRFLLEGRSNWEGAGKAYALASGNCYVCNRTLTDPESIELGIGPVCREKVGA